MTAGYSENGISGKTILAFILFIIDVALFFLCGHMVAENRAVHHSKLPQIPEGMSLTFIKDTDLEYTRDDTVHISSGTVVIPIGIHTHSVSFSYSDNNENKHLLADFDCFAEQKQLEQIRDEAINETRSIQSSIFWENFPPVIAFGLCFSVVWLIFTCLLVKIEWYVLLYVVDIVVMGVVYFGFGLFLCH